MTSPETTRMRIRGPWLAIAAATAVATLTVTAAATSTGASGETSTSEEGPTSSDGGETSTTEATSTTASGDTTTTGGGATTTVAGASATEATSSSAEFSAALAAECEGDTGHTLLADALQNVAVPDGSLRIIEILRTCDVEFVGSVDEALGRPTTNVEQLIADPVNNVTPNQAQLDVLNSELAVYWRIADAWAQSQAGASTTTAAGATTSVAAGSTAGSDVSTSGPAEESATTSG